MAYREPVLVVDDQLAHRRAASVHLKHHGFDPVEAESVRQAVEAVEGISDLCLVISDLQIHGGSARDVYLKVAVLVRQRGGLFVVLTNATLNNPDPHVARYMEFFAAEGVQVLRKPVFWVNDVIPLLEEAQARRGRHVPGRVGP